MKIKLRYVLIILLALLFLGSFVYKYQERLLLKKLVNSYNERLVQELALIEQSDKVNDETAELFVELLTNEGLSDEEYLQKLQDLQGKTRLVINGDENYIKTLTKNKEIFENLQNKAKLFVGRRGKFARDFIDKQLQYYNNELEMAQRNLTSDYLVLGIFSVMRDREIMNQFQAKTASNPEEDIPYYYADISVLEKYTRSEFSFEKEEEIKRLHPYGYEALERNKEYMESYYSIVKDYVAGDLESAAYKFSRLSEAELNLNIDFERLFDEGERENIELGKKILEVSFSKLNDVKQFKENSLGAYPIVGEINGWKEDLELCQLYQYKYSVVNAITDSYPQASNFDELIVELSRVAPKSDNLDSKFDRNYINYSGNEEEARFVCKDPESNKEFVYTIEKS